MILFLYRLMGTLGAPLISLYLHRRKKYGKEDPLRFEERLGRTQTVRPEGPLIWLHAASVGESLSLLPLIERLQSDRPDTNFLMTTGTVTSAALMADRLPNGIIHQFVPVDRPVYVRRFFDHWRPNLVLWSESDFWPNLVAEPQARGIPLILVNGRISPKSYKGWQRYPQLIKSLLSNFSLCLGQTKIDADRLKKLGAPVVGCVGNLKFAVKPLPVDDLKRTTLETQLGDRARWLGASTHPGEELLLWQAHQKLSLKHPGLLTILVPRHPNRGRAIAAELRAQGANVAVRSQDDSVKAETQIYLADTMGEMGLFFRVCRLVFMGKSLVDKGGQNPLEPAQLGCALLYGPYMWNFQEMIERLASLGASREVANVESLIDALDRFLSSPAEAETMAKKGQGYARSEAGVLDALCDELKPYLMALDSDAGVQ